MDKKKTGMRSEKFPEDGPKERRDLSAKGPQN